MLLEIARYHISCYHISCYTHLLAPLTIREMQSEQRLPRIVPPNALESKFKGGEGDALSEDHARNGGREALVQGPWALLARDGLDGEGRRRGVLKAVRPPPARSACNQALVSMQ